MSGRTMGEAGEPAVVEGVKGTWRVDPASLGQPFSGRAALLSPFDRLIHDRRRTVGKLDATADRVAGVLRVDAIHQDAAFTKTMSAGVEREIRDLAH